MTVELSQDEIEILDECIEDKLEVLRDFTDFENDQEKADAERFTEELQAIRKKLLGQ